MGFRITTWNVNGIRNPFSYQPWRENRTFQAMFETLEADIVIMQELKIQRKDLQDDMVLVPEWDVYFSLPQQKKGYSGVAIYTRNSTCAPIRAEEGITGLLTAPKTTTRYCDLPIDQQIGGYPRSDQLTKDVDGIVLDGEGRCVILEFPAFVLLGVYSPANRDESRDDFRLGFLEALDARVRNLIAGGKQVVLAGDLNVIRSELDSTNVAEAIKKNGITIDEWTSMPSRRLFNQLVFEGSINGDRDVGRENPVLWDLTRCFHPTRQGMNTCWDTKRNTRPANYGSRIDYILCSAGLKNWFVESDIQEGLMGSDHCPVFASASDHVQFEGASVALLDITNPTGMFSNGKRQRDWTQRDLLGLSAKLIAEFDRRQSIRDMFNKKSPAPKQPQSAQLSTAYGVGRSMDKRADTNAADTNNICQSSSSSKESAIPLASSRSPRALKRAVSSLDSQVKPKRRRQTADVTDNAKSKIVSGQPTLQSFFKTNGPSRKAPESAKSTAQLRIGAGAFPQKTSSDPRLTPLDSSGRGDLVPAAMLDQAPAGIQETVFDPIEAKESWSKLLGKRVVPRCEHDEPCISLTTKKAGVNCGRSFYICPRPLGPSGEKERDTEWRCSTFIWSSDWNRSQN